MAPFGTRSWPPVTHAAQLKRMLKPEAEDIVPPATVNVPPEEKSVPTSAYVYPANTVPLESVTCPMKPIPIVPFVTDSRPSVTHAAPPLPRLRSEDNILVPP